jgi:hypothetical protein
VTPLGTLRPMSPPVPELPSDPTRPEVPHDWHWKARRVLARFGPRTVPALIEALAAGDDPTIRQFAAEALGYLGHEGQSASDALRHTARYDEIPAVRAAAAAALKAIRAAVEEVESP